MRRDIEKLHQNLYVTEMILGALTSGESSDHVLEQLRSKVPMEKIVEQLEKVRASLMSSQSMQSEGTGSERDPGSSIAEHSDSWKTQPLELEEDRRTRPPREQLASGISDDEAKSEAGHAHPAHLSQWTMVTADKGLIEHLLALFFCGSIPRSSLSQGALSFRFPHRPYKILFCAFSHRTISSRLQVHIS
jgi:hypothetical protein